MSEPETRGIFWSTAGLGLASAAGYALQNSITRPIASRFSGDLSLLWLVIIAQTVSILISVGLLASHRDTLKSVKEIYSSRHDVLRLTMISFMGVGSLSLYVFAIGHVDQVFLSVVLNCYPFWYLLIGLIFFKDTLNRSTVNLLVWIMFVVCLGSMIVFGYRDAGDISLLTVMLYSLIPIIYATSFFLRLRFFKGKGLLAFIVATQLLDAPFIIALCVIALCLFEHSKQFRDIFRYDLLLYVIGSLANWGALYSLYRGSSPPHKATWLPAFMLFLVPGITALFSFIITETTSIDLRFNVRYLYLVAILSVCLILLKIANDYQERRSAAKD